MKRNRTVLGLCREFGVRVLQTKDYGVTYPVYGRPPTGWTYFSFDAKGRPCIVWKGFKPAPEDVLHELCHLLAGPDALVNESYLMPLQWVLTQLLVSRERKPSIQDFRNFGLGGVTVTPQVRHLTRLEPYVVATNLDFEVGEFEGETFTEIPEWRRMKEQARERGLLTDRDRPVMTAGILPPTAWKEHRVV